MEKDRLIDFITEIQSISQAGLFYGKDKFDKERYERLREIAIEMMAMKSEFSLDEVKGLFASDYGYQTPKVDTRAAVFKDDKILLVKENNGKWSLPGGWCEYNMSPMDNCIKECLEESGRNVSVCSIIAVEDRDKHNEPKYAYDVTKIFYLCKELSGGFKDNIETTGTAYYSLEEIKNLPLSLEKNNFEQIKMCFDAYNDKDFKTVFD